MKFKNPLIVATIIAMSLTSTSVFADDTNTIDKTDRKAHMMNAKWGDHKNSAAYDALDEETKATVMAIKEANKEAFTALKAEYKEMEQTDENKEALKAKMNELKDSLYADLQEALAGNDEALAALNEKMEKATDYANKKAVKTEARKANRGNKAEKVKGYKKAFSEKLKNNIDTISSEKLESVHSKIIVLVEKVEAKTNMDDDKQESLVAQLIALQEIIEDQIEMNALEA